MDHSNQDLDVSLVETLKQSDFVEAIGSVAEAGLDLMIKERALKDLPIIGSILSIAKTGFAIRDHLFIKKLISFLNEFTETSDRERKDFARELEVNAKLNEEAGTGLMLVLDRFSSTKKAELLGRACRARLKREISFQDLQRLTAAIDALNLIHLPDLRRYYGGDNPELDPLSQGEWLPMQSEAKQSLAIAGLLEIRFGSGAVIGGGPGSYGPNELGQLFCRVLFPSHAA